MPTPVPYRGIPFSRGIQPTEISPVDAWSGPYGATSNAYGVLKGTTTAGVSLANDSVLPAIRYQGQQVTILAWDSSQGKTLAYKYWYRGGTADSDLVEFASGAGGAAFDSGTSYTWTAPQYFSAGFSAAGGVTFISLTHFTTGLSAAGATIGTLTVNSGATVGGRLDVGGHTDLKGNLLVSGQIIGNFGVLYGTISQIYGGLALPDGLSAAGGITFNSRANFTQGLSASGATLGTLVVNNGISAAGGVTFANNVHVGGTLSVNGNFYVAGTLTTVNESQLLIEDKYLVLGSTFATGLQADGAGIYLGSTTSAIAGICYSNGSSEWSSSHSFDIPAASFYRVGGNNVLASTYLGSVVTGSSLASVGTLTNGVWNASVIGLAYGGTNKNLTSTGVSGGIVFKDGTGLSVLSSSGAIGNILRSNGENAAPSWTSPSTLTGLSADTINISHVSSNNPYRFLITAVQTNVNTYTTVRHAEGIIFNPSTNILTVTQIEAIVDGGTWGD